MKKKKSTIFWISVFMIILIVLGIKSYSDYQNKWNIYDIAPGAPGEENEVLIAQIDSVTPVSYKEEVKNDRFYANVDTNHVDDGIFYEPKEKHIDRGFLLEQNEKGNYSFVY